MSGVGSPPGISANHRRSSFDCVCEVELPLSELSIAKASGGDYRAALNSPFPEIVFSVLPRGGDTRHRNSKNKRNEHCKHCQEANVHWYPPVVNSYLRVPLFGAKRISLAL